MNILTDQAILSDDECKCKSCSAILFMSILGTYIPISQQDMDEILYPNTFLRYLLNRPIRSMPYIYPSSFKFQ